MGQVEAGNGCGRGGQLKAVRARGGAGGQHQLIRVAIANLRHFDGRIKMDAHAEGIQLIRQPAHDGP